MKKWYKVQFYTYVNEAVIKSLNANSGADDFAELFTKAKYIDDFVVYDVEQQKDKENANE